MSKNQGQNGGHDDVEEFCIHKFPREDYSRRADV
jgi:hypothetical protein